MSAFEVNGLRVEIVEGDITAARTDAIANAANDHLWMGSGVAGAIKRRGGEVIEREAVSKGPIPLGSAVETGAGKLPCRYVIHGAVMGQDLTTSAELVRRTTRSCLELADELGLQSLALPAFGTGVGGLALDECARAMLGALESFAPTGESLRGVELALFGEVAYAAFDRAARAMWGGQLKRGPTG